jgi:hypothetical protein
MSKLLKFLCVKNSKYGLMCIGGMWQRELDGGPEVCPSERESTRREREGKLEQRRCAAQAKLLEQQAQREDAGEQQRRRRGVAAAKCFVAG